MNTQITIEVPKDKIAKQITNPDGSINIIFVDKDPIRSKSWEEFCKNHPLTDYEKFINQHGGIDFRIGKAPRTPIDLATRKDAEGIIALIQLTRLHDEWAGNWKPDYSTRDEVKYQIKFPLNEANVTSHYSEPSLLDFPTREMAKEFLECFKDLIEKAKKFI